VDRTGRFLTGSTLTMTIHTVSSCEKRKAKKTQPRLSQPLVLYVCFEPVLAS
jgi:hypothetical protein